MTPHSLGVHKVLSLLTPAVRPLVNWNAERRLAAAVNVADVRDAAKARAHKMVFDYLDAGADDEITLRRNKDAFSQIELHYRVLAGLKPPLDLSTRIMGNDVDVPFFPSPTAGSMMFHRDGEKGVARAARSHGAMYCLSTMGTTSPRDVAKALDDMDAKGPRLAVSERRGITRREGITNAFPRASSDSKKGGKLFQLYVWKDRSLVRDLLAQAKDSGFNSLALTVDLTWYGNRERDTRNGFTVPPAYTLKQMANAITRPAWTWDFLSSPEYAYAALDVAAEARARRAAETSTREPHHEPVLPTDRRTQVAFIRDAFDPSFSWDDAEWLVQEWGDTGPVALKGVVRPDDALRAVERGFDAVWVSNHGGRQMETAPATVDVLPSVREALGGFRAWADARRAADATRRAGGDDAAVARAAATAAPGAATARKTGLPVEVLFDGGVQRGTDILKALALGADGVGVGKPYLYGLCAGGEAGVRRVFDILRDETERAMGLLGAGTVAEAREANVAGGGDFEAAGLVRRRAASARDFPDRGAAARGYGGGSGSLVRGGETTGAQRRTVVHLLLRTTPTTPTTTKERDACS